MKTLTRSCPICEGQVGRVLHRQAFLAPEELYAPSEVDIACCECCGFVFSDLAATQELLDENYSNHSIYVESNQAPPTVVHEQAAAVMGDETAAKELGWDLERLEGMVAFFASVLPDRSTRILDAGCASGSLLGRLKAHGYGNVVGIDPSGPAVAAARKAYGVEAVAGSFVTPPASLGTFDLVVLAHVMEHVLDVRSGALAIRSLLRDGGKVYIEVPDASRYHERLVAPFHDFNTEHINHFSPNALDQLMRSSGFRTLAIGRKLIRCSPTDYLPAAFGMWELGADNGCTVDPFPFERDDELVAGITEYVSASGRLMDTFAARIDAGVGGEPVVLWGAGQLSMKLLAGPLRAHRVQAIVDSSPQKWGMHIGGVKVSPPALLATTDAPVVVGSVHSQAEITETIRTELGARNRLILLRDPQMAR